MGFCCGSSDNQGRTAKPEGGVKKAETPAVDPSMTKFKFYKGYTDPSAL
jgi:hypothetical protein